MLRRLAVAVVLAIVCGSTVASADKAELERKFRDAQAKFNDRRYAEALDLFQEVYRTFSAPAILFNIAQCHRNLGDWAQAAAQFRRYLRESPDAANAAAVEDTVQQLDRLIEAVGYLRQQRYREALEIYDEVGGEADLPVLERDIGRAHERLGEYEDAQRAYRRYLEALPAAPDAGEIEADIERLERELHPKPGPGPSGDERRPVYKRWWFWGGVAAVVVVGGAAALALSGGPPDSTLGNIGFER